MRMGTFAQPCGHDCIPQLAVRLYYADRGGGNMLPSLALLSFRSESSPPKTEGAKASTAPGGFAAEPHGFSRVSFARPCPRFSGGEASRNTRATFRSLSGGCHRGVQVASESGPPLYYLKDKDGNLQPVPGFRFEDFEQMFREKLNRGSMPRYSLQALTIEGTAKTALAETKATFRILVRDDDWVRVPLRLDQAILRGPVEYKGPGQHLLHYENEGGGYVAWIRGGAGQDIN